MLLATNPGVKGPLDGHLPAGHVALRDGQWVWEIAADFNAELAAAIDWQFETATALDPNSWEALSLTHLERTPTGPIIRLPVAGVAQFLRLRLRGL